MRRESEGRAGTATGNRGLPGAALLVALAVQALSGASAAADEAIPPPGFKVAFLGDQGLGPGSEAALRLVRDEGADLLVHLGDFDYQFHPAAWEEQTDRVLGPGFPQVAVVGNHDVSAWNGQGGYGQLVRARLQRMGVEVRGEAGVKCSFRYRGIFFVLTAPGIMGQGHAEFIRQELAADSSAWRISAWHVNQGQMQVGSKTDEAGWGVYEQSLRGGAIIATAHEHTYSRTHLLSSMVSQTVASRSDTLRLQRGRTFAFVSGLGGGEIRPQLRTGPWWAKVYTSTQGATHGALFGVFHVDGDPRKAVFYFKAVDGTEVDRFEVRSELDRPVQPGIAPRPGVPRSLVLDPRELGLAPGSQVLLEDAAGRVVARVPSLQGPVTLTLPSSGLLFLRSAGPGPQPRRKFVILP